MKKTPPESPTPPKPSTPPESPTPSPSSIKLTRNQSLVMEALEKARGPLSAYDILDRLRASGLKAPLQVYRALDRLVALERVHRLESINAFMACRRPDCEPHEAMAFAICETCGEVSEIADKRLAGRLSRLAREAGFSPRKSTIELHGDCRVCRPG